MVPRVLTASGPDGPHPDHHGWSHHFRKLKIPLHVEYYYLKMRLCSLNTATIGVSCMAESPKLFWKLETATLCVSRPNILLDGSTPAFFVSEPMVPR